MPGILMDHHVYWRLEELGEGRTVPIPTCRQRLVNTGRHLPIR